MFIPNAIYVITTILISCGTASLLICCISVFKVPHTNSLGLTPWISAQTPVMRRRPGNVLFNHVWDIALLQSPCSQILPEKKKKHSFCTAAAAPWRYMITLTNTTHSWHQVFLVTKCERSLFQLLSISPLLAFPVFS